MIYFGMILLALIGIKEEGFPQRPHGSNLSDVKGPVKKVIEHRYYSELKNNKAKKGEWVETSVMLYNEEGNMTQRIVYSPNDTLIDTYVYSNGLLIEANYQTDWGGSVKENFRYDFDSLTVYIASIHRNGVKSLDIEQYDITGKLISISELDSLGNLISEQKYIYNLQGQNTEWHYRKAKGTTKTISQYNLNDDVISEVHLNENGKTTSQSEFEYDKRGNLTKAHIYDPEWGVGGYKFFSKCSKFDKFGNNRFRYFYSTIGHVNPGTPTNVMILEREILYYK